MAHNGNSAQDKTSYRPKFFVTQEEYDNATPEERERFNYEVEEERTLKLPKSFNRPKEE